MFKDNPLLAQLKQQIRETVPTVEGIVKATEKGFGFLQIDSKTSYFISPPQMRKLIHGDKVSGALRENDGKQSFEPENLLESSLRSFIARVSFKDKRCKITADHPLIHHAIAARSQKGKTLELKEGDWVKASLTQHALDKGQFQAEITDFIAHGDDCFARWKATTANHNLAWDEPEDNFEFEQHNISGKRQDLSDTLFFTIDGESTLDMDDAIAIKTLDNGWELSVAIADPSAYIPLSHPLENEARERAFTLYLPARTVPMMPKKLANELCSLKANEMRPALVCRFNVSAQGELSEHIEFFEAEINSKHRLNYDTVSDFIENQSDAFEGELAQALNALNQLSLARNAWREQHGNVFGDQADYEFELDLRGRVIDIHCKPRRSANRMIEEAMVAANICAGKFLHDKLGYGVYSHHIGFKEDKLPQVVELLAHFGLNYSPEQLTELAHFCALSRELKQPQYVVLEALLKRFYNFGEYSDKALPHFGLGEVCYATWTSPIRKYSDLLNHRLLKSIICNEPHNIELNGDLFDHLGELRRKHKFAERDMANYLYSQYFNEADKQQVFDAVVVNVSRGGIQVRLSESGASAFIGKNQLFGKDAEINSMPEHGYIEAGELRFELKQALKVSIGEVNTLAMSLNANLA